VREGGRPLIRAGRGLPGHFEFWELLGGESPPDTPRIAEEFPPDTPRMDQRSRSRAVTRARKPRRKNLEGGSANQSRQSNPSPHTRESWMEETSSRESCSAALRPFSYSFCCLGVMAPSEETRVPLKARAEPVEELSVLPGQAELTKRLVGLCSLAVSHADVETGDAHGTDEALGAGLRELGELGHLGTEVTVQPVGVDARPASATVEAFPRLLVWEDGLDPALSKVGQEAPRLSEEWDLYRVHLATLREGDHVVNEQRNIPLGHRNALGGDSKYHFVFWLAASSHALILSKLCALCKLLIPLDQGWVKTLEVG